MTIPGLQLQLEGEVPVYRQIADGVKAAARRGELADGHRLPPTRDLARQLGVNRNTVIAAYDTLATEGWIESHTGRGTFLVHRAGDASEPDWGGAFSSSIGGVEQGGLRTIFNMVTAGQGISFVGSYPDASLMPADTFRRALESALREDRDAALAYGPTAGHPALRAAIAEGMRRRGSTVGSENVLITNGAQQALDLIFRAFLDPGDAIVIEEPTYTGALSVIGCLGARAVTVPVDEGGIDVDRLAQVLDRHRPKLIYLQPTFHNPTTAVMDRERRQRVLELAHRARVPLVEDDWGGDLRFEGDDEPTLHALDGGRGVIYLSTFSKKLMPGLRIGWLAAPRAVQQRLVELKCVQDCGTSPLLQVALMHFLRDGGLERHLDYVRPVYRQRRDHMAAALLREFPASATWRKPPGGLFLWVRLPDGLNPQELQHAARQRDVLYSRGELFGQTADRAPGMRLTYSAATPDEIDRGISILGQLIHERTVQRERDRPDSSEAMPIL